MPNTPKKTNQFYKLILHDSKLVKLTHNIDIKEDANITHLTFQIEQVLSFLD